RGHVLGKIIDLILLEAVLDLGAHHVADKGFRTEPMGDTSHGDIRSVIIPTKRSFSPTGSTPMSRFSISAAASRSVWLGLARQTSRVMTSLTFIRFSFSSARVFLRNGPLLRAVPITPSLSDDFSC